MSINNYKRDSETIDKLLAEVVKLVSDGMSVNRACGQVGLQPTVYYYRQRKDSQPQAKIIKITPEFSSFTEDQLLKRFRELENELQQVQMELGKRVTERKKA